MNDLARYLELIVEPTFDDFSRNPTSARHAFLASVAAYHAIDRVAPRNRGNLRKKWGKESMEFKLVDIVAHHFKHGKSDDERIAPAREGIPISFVLGFNESGDEMELRNYFFVLRDAIKFLHRKAAG